MKQNCASCQWGISTPDMSRRWKRGSPNGYELHTWGNLRFCASWEQNLSDLIEEAVDNVRQAKE